MIHSQVKEARKLRLDTVAMRVPGRVEKFSALMQSTSASPDTSASASWSGIRKSIYQKALESFGKKTHTNKDWPGESIDAFDKLMLSTNVIQVMLHSSRKNIKSLPTMVDLYIVQIIEELIKAINCRIGKTLCTFARLSARVYYFYYLLYGSEI